MSRTTIKTTNLYTFHQCVATMKCPRDNAYFQIIVYLPQEPIVAGADLDTWSAICSNMVHDFGLLTCFGYTVSNVFENGTIELPMYAIEEYTRQSLEYTHFYLKEIYTVA